MYLEERTQARQLEAMHHAEPVAMVKADGARFDGRRIFKCWPEASALATNNCSAFFRCSCDFPGCDESWLARLSA
jgi:hypothetical protein